MPSAATVWEDDDNNRKVSFAVEYTVDSEGIQLVEVTPSRIDFANHSIQVWTDKGRAMLRAQAEKAGQLAHFVTQIENRVLATS